MNTARLSSEKHEEIAKLAYKLWSKAGHEQGRDLEFWLEAEKQFQPNVQAGAKHQPHAQRNHIR
jgi:hypothetical protein